MMTMNKVMVAGNLTRDPALRQTGTGTAVGSFALAVNEHYTTKNGEKREDTQFIDIEVWGKQAENCEQYLKKGAPAFVEGRLRLHQWEDKNTGDKKSRVIVRADRVQFLNSSGQRNHGNQPANAQ
jgi:single-strand DNA-binding protein